MNLSGDNNKPPVTISAKYPASFHETLPPFHSPFLAVNAENMNSQYIPVSAQSVQQTDSAHFTGAGHYERLPLMPGNGEVAVAHVHFPPGVFTDWHSHAQGQYLIVTEGTGRFQEWGEPQQTIRKGDVVWIPPHAKHWHGAGEYTAMSHIALSPVKENAVQWFEKAMPEAEKNPAAIEPVTTEKLTAPQLAILPVAIAVAQGNQACVKTAIENALQTGLAVNEIKESITHQFAYIGAPKMLNGINTLKALIEARQQQGIDDETGKTATDLGAVDYYQSGTEKLAALSRRPTQSPVFAFAPSADYAIKAQLFGYQFSRDNLSDLQREIAALGSLVAQGEGVNAQLKSHLAILRNLGLKTAHFAQLLDEIERTHSKTYRNNVSRLLDEINL